MNLFGNFTPLWAEQARPCWTESIRHINLIYWHRSEFCRGATEGHDQRHTFMVYIRRAVDYVSDRYNHQNISHGASFEHFSLARAWATARQGGGGEGCNGGGAMRALLRGKVFQSWMKKLLSLGKLEMTSWFISRSPPMLPSWIDPSVCRCHNISSHLLSAQKYRLYSELARRLLAS